MPDNSEALNIAIFGGAGASGRVLAALLKEAGHNVTIVDPEVQRLREARGINLTFEDGEVVSVDFSENDLITPKQVEGHDFGKVDLVINTTMAYDLTREHGELLAQVANGAPILELTNGLKGHKKTDFTQAAEETLVHGVLEHPVIITADGGTRVKVDRARIAQDGIAVGSDAPGNLREIKEAFAAAGIGVKDQQTTKEVIWGKLASIMSMGIQVVLDTKFADAADKDKPTGQIATEAIREFHEVAQSQGLKFDDFGEFIEKQRVVMEGKGAAKGSLYGSVAKGARTEAEAIYGAVIEVANERDIDVPYLECIYQLTQLVEAQAIQDKEQSRAGATKDGLSEMRGEMITAIDTADGGNYAEKFFNADFSAIEVRDGALRPEKPGPRKAAAKN